MIALATDYYKIDHMRQYPKGTELVFSNFTPRKSRVEGTDSIVFFGLQYFIKEYLIDKWDREFFSLPKEEAVGRYKRVIENTLGKGAITYKHIEDLHDLRYLPIRILALPEGTTVPMKVPPVVLWNTLPEFFWLTNYLETLMSCILWGPCTSATTASAYRRILEDYAIKTVGNTEFVKWQGHDFSFRGMFGLEAACLSGAGHLLSFTGTDSIPAIEWLERYYNADVEKELVGGSVPATEHAVMSMGTKDNEIGTFIRLITEVYPSGIVSIVSDTWDFWKVLSRYTVSLKDIILARDGKLVFRPDSGDPVEIICGNTRAQEGTPERRGAVELLWDIFGGTVTDQGYKVLDSHVGLIYGDSITVERCAEICKRLEKKGFASTNVVFGIGSFTYQYVTRDTYGFAMKATYGVVNGESREIFKSPATDDGTKISARGLVTVNKNDLKLVMRDQVMWEDVEGNGSQFRPVFNDGKLLIEDTLQDIRDRLWG